MDRYVNPFLPSGPRVLRRLPARAARFLGHREKMETEKDSDLVVWLWAFVGAFAGVAVIENVFLHWRFMAENGAPIIIGSYVSLFVCARGRGREREGGILYTYTYIYIYISHILMGGNASTQGAAAILVYNSIDSPLAQPRNAFGGQLVSALVGVATTKLFMLSPHFETELVWVAGALSCALASVAMGVTKTVHPPAGATALLAAVDSRVRDMGWLLVPVVIVSSGLMIAVGLLLGNVQRTYPRYWWTPGMVGRGTLDVSADAEKGMEKEKEKKGGMTDVVSDAAAAVVVVERDRIVVPDFIVLGAVERNVLEVLRGRIQEHLDDMEADRLSGITPQDTLR